MAIDIAIDRFDMRPDAYAVFVLGTVPKELHRYGEHMDVIVEDSLVKLAKIPRGVIG